MDTHVRHLHPRVRSYDHSINSHEAYPLEETHHTNKADRPEMHSSGQYSDFAPARKNRPRSWNWHIFSHVVSFTWIIPMIALLALNFRNFIIGPSAWCPTDHCTSQIWINSGTIWDNDTSTVQALQFDRADHNVLGVLQLLAKALEVWFVLLATALVHDVTMIIAKSEGGLPIGHLLTHAQFPDIRNILNLSLWTWSKLPAGASINQNRNTTRLFFFALVAVLLTILTNLMGPASAVLILPTVQWVDTEPVFTHSYAYLDTVQGDLALDGCNATDLAAGRYSCAYDTYGKVLDQRALQTLTTTSQQDHNPSIDRQGFSIQEYGMKFLLNVTRSSTDIALAPNRELIQFLANDLIDMANPSIDSSNIATTNWLRNSLALVMKQKGPSVGFLGTCHLGNFTKIEISSNKEVWCFDNWESDYGSDPFIYTKCFRTGKDFNAANNQTAFSIANTNAASESLSTVVDVIFSDKAIYFNSSTDFDSGISTCLKYEHRANCDWDKIFSTSLPQDVCDSSDMCRLSHNLTLVTYSQPVDHGESFGTMKREDTSNNTRFYCDHVSYLGFPTYSFEPSKSANPTQIGYMTSGDPSLEDSHTLMIDLSWILAAWSVDNNGTIGRHRQVSQGMTNTLPAVLQSTPRHNSATGQLIAFHYHTLLHALSMVKWSIYDPNPAETECPLDPLTAEGNHCLQKWVSRRVWAYSIGSRTSKLGATVVIIGIIVAVARLCLGVFHPNREHSLLGLFIAALRHTPQGELERGRMRDAGEKTVGRNRYRIVDDEEQRPRFVPTQNKSGWNELEEDWQRYRRPHGT